MESIVADGKEGRRERLNASPRIEVPRGEKEETDLSLSLRDGRRKWRRIEARANESSLIFRARRFEEPPSFVFRADADNSSKMSPRRLIEGRLRVAARKPLRRDFSD